MRSRTIALAFAVSALLPVAAAGAVEPGGLGAKGSLALADVTCLKQCVDTHKATPGAVVKVRGVAMEQVSQVVFRGATGPLAVAPAKRTEGAATAIVPEGAVASRPYVVDAAGQKSERSPHKLFILPRTAIPAAAYPIRGPHQLWEGFGGARNHQGADVGAACGTPLVAALPGKVQTNEFHPRAGYHLVIDLAGSDDDIAYMHLVRPSPLQVGQPVGPAQAIGNVGDSGNASGCHLHFEYWAGDWWGGGEPIDPVPILKQWEQEGAPAASRR
jgi:murein DD-endopeptidase MepM/ murein hydrolase activator NlpD